jgi:D-3-phosphoglycerate dehydrogenase / 2-oxoglutarate reductase
MPRILVTPTALRNAPGPYRDALTRAGLEVVDATVDEANMTESALIAQLEGIEGVLAGMDPFTPAVLGATRLRAIARMGVGYDAIDVPAATRLKIPVTITPGTNEHSVAEQAMALILGTYRGVASRDREVRRGGAWQRKPLKRLAGRTLGLVGLGRIGKAVVPRAIGMGLKVIAYDPKPDGVFASAFGVALCSLDELLAAADIVSLHLPCTKETVDLINAAALAKMKPGSVLINTSRGGLVDETALADALASGHLFAAGLDVFKVEPLPLSSRLLSFDNVLLAPHMGGLDEESSEAMATLAAECLANLYRGKWPEGCVVNDELRQGWKW